MQLVPKTTRNPHQIGGVVLRLGAWSGAGRVWGRATGEEGQTAGPVLLPLPGSLRGLDTSVRQKQTSRRAPAQTGIPWQRFGAEVLGTWRRVHRQVSSMLDWCMQLLYVSHTEQFLPLYKLKLILLSGYHKVKSLHIMPLHEDGWTYMH